tara:strand:+ start:1282 stop:2265 length:984 start_codon:yes stop_codon:yes gene_type:complete
VLGEISFADDQPPHEALVVIRNDADWAVGETLHAARESVGKVQGRRTSIKSRPPLDLPPGDWSVTLRTGWVEPAYLETDASWCEPSGESSNPLANGGAFGGKTDSDVSGQAESIAAENGVGVRVLWSREDVVRYGSKRPPLSAGFKADGSGVIRVAKTPGVEEIIQSVLPRCEIEQIEVAGPPTSVALRAAGWAEAEMLKTGLLGYSDWVEAPSGARARAEVDTEIIRVEVESGTPLDLVMHRSYCIGAAHMAYSWVTSESLSVDDSGEVHDLTVRSFGVLRSSDCPHIEIVSVGEGEALAAGDAVFAAVAAATWLNRGCPSDLPTG